MKSIVIAGNLGKDAVTRRTQDGTAVTGFSVAVEDRTGKEKSTMWFDVSIWGKRGEALQRYLTQGTKVVVSGELTQRTHEGKTYLGVRADNVTLMGGGESRKNSPEDYIKGGAPADLDDTIPFAPWVL